MLRALRIGVGVLLIGLLLAGAQLATRDCTAGLFRYDNCLWMAASEYLGLPQQSKALRAVFLEGVGLSLLAGLYLTYRYILSSALKPRTGRAQTNQGVEAEPIQPPRETPEQATDPRQKDGA
jgi:hypothetical protein